MNSESKHTECKRCKGTGEIVTDWDRYLDPRDGDKGDEAVADCPDCGGQGHIARVEGKAS